MKNKIYLSQNELTISTRIENISGIHKCDN